MSYRLVCIGVGFLLGISVGCSKKEEIVAPIPFADNFNRDALGKFWKADWGWRIVNGEVFTSGSQNQQPLWLKARLPEHAVIEFDVRSESSEGDIKFEIYGDGRNHASGYILIFGGWKNTISCIARLDEHGADRQEIKRPGLVKQGKSYHMKVVRKDKTLHWYVDGKMFLDYFDSEPLAGPGHDRLAFNSWATQLYFDNLHVRAATAQD